MNAAVLTIVSKNYLPFARTLMRSVERHNPAYRRFVILTDTVDACFDPATEPFTTILSSDLSVHKNQWLYFKYSILELNTAIKPCAIEHLAEHFGVDWIVYLDPDIKVYNPLDSILDRLLSNDILLTPHLLDPVDDGFTPAELNILQAGAYNLGFIAIRNNQNAMRFLRWWQNKLLNHCYIDFEGGLFADQRWMDLVPGMFPNVGIVRDAGCNVAYWNIKTRLVEEAPADTFTVGGGPLYFFHFSGIDIASPHTLSKHQNRFQLRDLPVIQRLVLDYTHDVRSHDYALAQKWPYAYGRFQNGVAIPDKLRRFTAECPDLVARMIDPFSSEAYLEYVKYWNSFVRDPMGNSSPITRLAQVIYNKRPDIQSRAPQIFGKDLAWFLEWFVHNAPREYGVDETFIAPLAAHRNLLIHERGIDTSRTATPTGSAYGPASLPGLNIVGYLHAEMGVGEASRCAVKAAGSVSLAVSLNNFGLTQSRQQDVCPGVVDNRFLYDINLFNVNADQTHVLFEHLEKSRYAGKYNIGFWVWELEEFPDAWVDAYRYYDEIWVPSAFCQATITRKSPVPVVRVPYGIELDLPDPASRVDLPISSDKFTFLSFLDVLSVPKRKNIEGVIAAFRKSGTERSGGRLIIKVNNGKHLPRVVEKLAEECASDGITLINETWSRQKVNALIDRCDCLVSLHRSEGFGLTIAEAMYLGKPVIATAYSGNMDFTRRNTAMLVDYSLVPVGPSAEPYDPVCRWAEPDTDQAAEWMERVQMDVAWRARIGKAGQHYIRKHFAPTVVGGIMKTRVRRILGRNLTAKAAALLRKSLPTVFRLQQPAPKRS